MIAGLRRGFATSSSVLLVLAAAGTATAQTPTPSPPTVAPPATPPGTTNDTLRQRRVALFPVTPSFTSVQLARPSVFLETTTDDTVVTGQYAVGFGAVVLGINASASLVEDEKHGNVVSLPGGFSDGLSVGLQLNYIRLPPLGAVTTRLQEFCRSENIQPANCDVGQLSEESQDRFDRYMAFYGRPWILSFQAGLGYRSIEYIDLTNGLMTADDSQWMPRASAGIGWFLAPEGLLAVSLGYRLRAQAPDPGTVCRNDMPMMSGTTSYIPCQTGILDRMSRNHEITLRAEWRQLLWGAVGINPAAALVAGIGGEDDPLTPQANETNFGLRRLEYELPIYFNIGGENALNFGLRPALRHFLSERTGKDHIEASLSLFLGGQFSVDFR